MGSCPNCGRDMERIESDETAWWECPSCGIEPIREDESLYEEDDPEAEEKEGDFDG
jgi:hypothetical protein